MSISIEELIDLCRAKGVIHAKVADMEITLGAEPARELPDHPVIPGPVGADGLTRAEQEALYGTPFPDTREKDP